MGEFGLKIRHRCVSQSEGGGIGGTQKSHCFRVLGSPHFLETTNLVVLSGFATGWLYMGLQCP